MGSQSSNRARSEYSGIRVYRNASHTLTTTIEQLPWDADSSLLTATGLSRSGNDIVANTDGHLQIGVFVQASAAVLASGLSLEIRKNPAGANTLLASRTCPGPLNSDQSQHADAVCDVVSGDVIRVMAASLGDSANVVVGDGVTWAYAFIMP